MRQVIALIKKQRYNRCELSVPQTNRKPVGKFKQWSANTLVLCPLSGLPTMRPHTRMWDRRPSVFGCGGDLIIDVQKAPALNLVVLELLEYSTAPLRSSRKPRFRLS